MKRDFENFNESAFNEAALIADSLDRLLCLILENQPPEDKELIGQLFGAIKLSELIGTALKKVEDSIYIQ